MSDQEQIEEAAQRYAELRRKHRAISQDAQEVAR